MTIQLNKTENESFNVLSGNILVNNAKVAVERQLPYTLENADYSNPSFAYMLSSPLGLDVTLNGNAVALSDMVFSIEVGQSIDSISAFTLYKKNSNGSRTALTEYVVSNDVFVEDTSKRGEGVAGTFPSSNASEYAYYLAPKDRTVLTIDKTIGLNKSGIDAIWLDMPLPNTDGTSPLAPGFFVQFVLGAGQLPPKVCMPDYNASDIGTDSATKISYLSPDPDGIQVISDTEQDVTTMVYFTCAKSSPNACTYITRSEYVAPIAPQT